MYKWEPRTGTHIILDIVASLNKRINRDLVQSWTTLRERARKKEPLNCRKITRQSKCNIQRRKKDIVGPQYQTRRGRQIGRTMSAHLCKYPLRCQTEAGAAAFRVKWTFFRPDWRGGRRFFLYLQVGYELTCNYLLDDFGRERALAIVCGLVSSPSPAHPSALDSRWISLATGRLNLELIDGTASEREATSHPRAPGEKKSRCRIQFTQIGRRCEDEAALLLAGDLFQCGKLTVSSCDEEQGHFLQNCGRQ